MSSSETPLEQTNLFKSRTYVRLLGLQFLFGVSYSSFLLLPKYLARDLHASATEVGRAAAFALVAAAILAPLVGTISSRFSRKKLLLAAFLFEGLSALAFLAVERVGALLFALRILQGLSWALVFNTTATLAAEVVPREKMAQAIGYLGLAMLGTNALAPLVAEPLADSSGFKSVFVFAGIAALAGTALVFQLSPDERSTTSKGSSRAPHGALFAVHLASLLMGVGIGVMFTFTQPFALALGAKRVGVFFLGHVAFAALVRTVFARSADRIGPALASTFGLAAYACTVLFTASLAPWGLFIAGGALGTCHGFLYPALTAAGMNRVEVPARADFMGWFSGAFNTGCALSTLGLGPIADHFGYRLVYVLAGLAMALGVAPLAFFARRNAENAASPG